jgi:hypothetical protein
MLRISCRAGAVPLPHRAAVLLRSGFVRSAFWRRWRYPRGGRSPLRCRVIKRDHHRRCISIHGARRCCRCLRPVCCCGMRYCRMTRVGFLVGMGSVVIGRDDGVLRSALGLYSAGGGRCGLSHGVTPPGLTGGWSRLGYRRRVAIGRSVGAHHVDWRQFDGIVRAGCKKTAGR